MLRNDLYVYKLLIDFNRVVIEILISEYCRDNISGDQRRRDTKKRFRETTFDSFLEDNQSIKFNHTQNKVCMEEFPIKVVNLVVKSQGVKKPKSSR